MASVDCPWFQSAVNSTNTWSNLHGSFAATISAQQFDPKVVTLHTICRTYLTSQDFHRSASAHEALAKLLPASELTALFERKDTSWLWNNEHFGKYFPPDPSVTSPLPSVFNFTPQRLFSELEDILCLVLSEFSHWKDYSGYISLSDYRQKYAEFLQSMQMMSLSTANAVQEQGVMENNSDDENDLAIDEGFQDNQDNRGTGDGDDDDSDSEWIEVTTSLTENSHNSSSTFPSTPPNTHTATVSDDIDVPDVDPQLLHYVGKNIISLFRQGDFTDMLDDDEPRVDPQYENEMEREFNDSTLQLVYTTLLNNLPHHSQPVTPLDECDFGTVPELLDAFSTQQKCDLLMASPFWLLPPPSSQLFPNHFPRPAENETNLGAFEQWYQTSIDNYSSFFLTQALHLPISAPPSLSSTSQLTESTPLTSQQLTHCLDLYLFRLQQSQALDTITPLPTTSPLDITTPQDDGQLVQLPPPSLHPPLPLLPAFLSQYIPVKPSTNSPTPPSALLLPPYQLEVLAEYTEITKLIYTALINFFLYWSRKLKRELITAPTVPPAADMGTENNTVSPTDIYVKMKEILQSSFFQYFSTLSKLIQEERGDSPTDIPVLSVEVEDKADGSDLEGIDGIGDEIDAIEQDDNADSDDAFILRQFQQLDAGVPTAQPTEIFESSPTPPPITLSSNIQLTQVDPVQIRTLIHQLLLFKPITHEEYSSPYVDISLQQYITADVSKLPILTPHFILPYTITQSIRNYPSLNDSTSSTSPSTPFSDSLTMQMHPIANLQSHFLPPSQIESSLTHFFTTESCSQFNNVRSFEQLFCIPHIFPHGDFQLRDHATAALQKYLDLQRTFNSNLLHNTPHLTTSPHLPTQLTLSPTHLFNALLPTIESQFLITSLHTFANPLLLHFSKFSPVQFHLGLIYMYQKPLMIYDLLHQFTTSLRSGRDVTPNTTVVAPFQNNTALPLYFPSILKYFFGNCSPVHITSIFSDKVDLTCLDQNKPRIVDSTDNAQTTDQVATPTPAVESIPSQIPPLPDSSLLSSFLTLTSSSTPTPQDLIHTAIQAQFLLFSQLLPDTTSRTFSSSLPPTQPPIITGTIPTMTHLLTLPPHQLSRMFTVLAYSLSVEITAAQSQIASISAYQQTHLHPFQNTFPRFISIHPLALLWCYFFAHLHPGQLTIDEQATYKQLATSLAQAFKHNATLLGELRVLTNSLLISIMLSSHTTASEELIDFIQVDKTSSVAATQSPPTNHSSMNDDGDQTSSSAPNSQAEQAEMFMKDEQDRLQAMQMIFDSLSFFYDIDGHTSRPQSNDSPCNFGEMDGKINSKTILVKKVVESMTQIQLWIITTNTLIQHTLTSMQQHLKIFPQHKM